ncbi:hypothetical protein K456DRAFT_43949 [Colletotrichum gloeosporioides 23]|nr:hypothetical protein K456DRAFT_43949 [Colletotrichum gloeosporioides 23]
MQCVWRKAGSLAYPYGSNDERLIQDDEPHVTASWKVQEKDNHFHTAHGYTRGSNNFDIRNVSGGRSKIPLDGKHKRGKSSWVENEESTELFTEEYLDELSLPGCE